MAQEDGTRAKGREGVWRGIVGGYLLGRDWWIGRLGALASLGVQAGGLAVLAGRREEAVRIHGEQAFVFQL